MKFMLYESKMGLIFGCLKVYSKKLRIDPIAEGILIYSLP